MSLSPLASTSIRQIQEVGCDSRSADFTTPFSDRSILVIGGGVIGAAIALELRQRGAEVTLVSRSGVEAAGLVAAGMLAPQAEAIESGPMLELCLRSRALYPEWVMGVEAIAQMPSGYWPSGILCPLYAQSLGQSLGKGDWRARLAQQSMGEGQEVQAGQWLSAAEVHQLQPGLSTDVAGGWWFAKDGQVDSRRQLFQALRVAAERLGVRWHEGVEVLQLRLAGDRLLGLETSQGLYEAEHYVLAAGAWSGQVVSLPVVPRKGQLVSVQTPPGVPRLQRVLYGEGIYIVPRRDGLIVLGATSEDVGFRPDNTPAGVEQLLREAMRLYPVLADYPTQESWWGYRPATPDELPILGPSPYQNLTLATGHYRNGILLAPVTAQMIGDWVLNGTGKEQLQAFSWERFLDLPGQ